ncbi:MAG: glucose-1-phosphate cytidylyltransferase [Candidatus Margulisbacteria bacterium]|nr:glucose-1-phosphate cytidylyltransferase [Candidatus Margulisiibacteriota bacterium]
MKVVILAGGFGSRLSEETDVIPKPMVEIGGKPIIWHIMKIYSQFGFHDFVICLGYKGYIIKEYFANYFLHQSDITFDLTTNKTIVHSNASEPWKVTLVDTGPNTMTGGRIKRIQKYVGNESFMLTYGDGVADVNIKELVKFHKSHGKLATLTSVQTEGRFGAIDMDKNNKVSYFMEKPKGDGSWINGGFFVCEPQVFDYIENDQVIFEQEPLKKLTKEGQLFSFKHHGFWRSMDTLREKIQLNDLWNNNKATWKIW